jgi:hypothetical protein
MKRNIVLACLLASVAALCFGDITFKADGIGSISIAAKGKGAFVPLQTITTDTGTDYYAYDGKTHFRANEIVKGVEAEIRIAAATANNAAGVKFDMDYQGGSTPSLDNVDSANVWLRPFPFAKITVGKFYDSALKGKVSLERDMALYAAGYVPSGNVIFTQFVGTRLDSAIITLTPLDGLFIGVQFGHINEASPANNYAEEFFRTFQIGAGYYIPNIGHVRAQVIGRGRHANSNMLKYNVFEGAFAFTRVKGLTVDTGFKIGFGGEDFRSASKGFQNSLAAGVNYNYQGKWGIVGLASYYFANDSDKSSASNYVDSNMSKPLIAEPLYNPKAGLALEGAYAINSTIMLGVNLNGSFVKDANKYGVGGYVQKTVAPNCTVTTGIAARIDRAKDAENTIVSIPIVLAVFL